MTVGRPLGLLLTRKSENATVTLCHTGTRDLAAHTRGADIVVAAAGVAHLVTAEMVKPGAAVLDVGITRTDSGLVGDVHPDVREVAAFLAPMPGGTGPMTRAMLLANVVESAERAAGLVLTVLSRLRGEWPLTSVLVVVAVGLVVVGDGHFRRGTVLLSFGVALALFLRLLLPSAEAACWPCAPSGSTSWCSRSSPWPRASCRSGSPRRARERRGTVAWMQMS